MVSPVRQGRTCYRSAGKEIITSIRKKEGKARVKKFTVVYSDTGRLSLVGQGIVHVSLLSKVTPSALLLSPSTSFTVF